MAAFARGVAAGRGGLVAIVAATIAWVAPANGDLPPAQAWRDAASARTIRVGPGEPLRRVADAARVARDGDTVLIAPGEYVADVAAWTQNRLTIRADNCCVRMLAAGASAEGKAIWVIKGDEVIVEGIHFESARVEDGNGAGIRHQGGRLTVRNCRFTDNELGLLTWNDGRAELIVERSEFDRNVRANRGIAHQIYVGRIARFVLRESYVHAGAVGHLVKSRARENEILYNRLTDGAEGHASYELEFPEGGVARVVGNVIAQSARTENPVILSIGAEGYRYERNELWLVHNTFVDEGPGSAPVLQVWPGATKVHAIGNLWYRARPPYPPPASPDDVAAGPRDVPGADRGDYRLSRRSPLAHATTRAPDEGAPVLDREYVQPRSSRALPKGARLAGAVQELAP